MQLTVEAILNLINFLKEDGMTDEEIKHLKIYIGNDDELNGIHTAWYVNLLDDSEDNADLIEMINEDAHNYEFPGKALLIS